PTANNQSLSTQEDTAVAITPTGSDPEGDILTYSLVSQPRHGTATANPDGSFTYTPAPNYNGPDSFTFKASDRQPDSNIATVSIPVTPVNDPPVLRQPGDQTVNEGGTLSLQLSATDIDSGSLTFSKVSGPTGLSVSASGLVQWQTTEADGPGTYSVTVQ